MQTNSESLQLSGEPADKTHRIRSLSILVIHAHSSCNCRCVMCDIWKTKEQKIFGVYDLKGQLDSIRRLGVQWIVFSGGEPLMNPELPEVCAIVRAEGIRLTLLTTGLLLKKHARNVAEHFDDIIISLDGPQCVHDSIRRVTAGFSLIESGIKAIRELRSDIRITARCTIQKANYEYLFETARTAKLLGLSGISFLAADLTSQAFNRLIVWPSERQAEVALSLSEVVGLEDEIERLIRNGEREFGVGFIVESAAKLRRIVQHFRAHLGLEAAKAPMCNAPWVSAVIEVDGSVRPCFFHAPVGSLQRTSLENVVNGEQARNFRTQLDVTTNPTCQNCVCSLNYRD